MHHHVFIVNVFGAQIGKLVATLNAQLESSGRELIAYREKHGIRVRGEDDQAGDKSSDTSKSGASGVLVAKDSS